MENQPPEDSFWSNRRWLARLSFSFLIVAAFLLFTAYREMQAHALTAARASLYLIGALMAFVMFLLGVRARHRPGE
jgi:hypothetical protein